MESCCKPPKNLSFDGDVSVNWRKFRQNFEIFLKASGSEKKESEVKVALLLNFMGEEGVERYNSFNLEGDEKNDIDKVVQAFQEYCAPKRNVLSESVKFFNRSQTVGETFDSFLTSLQELSETCDYGNMRDRMIRDGFVAGIRDEALREKLLRSSDLDLQTALEICRVEEALEAEAKALEEEKNVPGSEQKRAKGTKRKNVEPQPEQKFDCNRCAMSHIPNQCPTFKKKCKECGVYNHFTISCKAKDTMEEEEASDEETGSRKGETNKARSEATFCYTVNNFSKMKNPEFSPPCYVRNLPWKIDVRPYNNQKNSKKFLGFYLECNGGSESTTWRCYADAEVRLLSNEEGTEPFSERIHHLFQRKSDAWGFPEFISWQDVLDVENGYIKDDSITLEVHLVAGESYEEKYKREGAQLE